MFTLHAYVIGVLLGESLLGLTDSLSKTKQTSSMTAADAGDAADYTISALDSLHLENNFTAYFDTLEC